jgi:glycosyltransferase involved in cell wall biosynthesis
MPSLLPGLVKSDAVDMFEFISLVQTENVKQKTSYVNLNKSLPHDLMPVQLSVVIITLNEEGNLGRCLESVRTIADEIVVVDSFSSDSTPAIATRFGARFIQRKFDGYVSQKNFADQQATYPHILSIDADEVLSPELKAEIAGIKNNWQMAGYYLNRLTNYCGTWVRHGGWYPDKKLRLYDRGKGRWHGLLLHEEYQLTANEKTGRLKSDLLHYSFNSISDHLRQVDHFTNVSSQEMRMQGRQPSFWPMLYKPASKFVEMYLLKTGFRDGAAGFCIAVISSYAAFVKYAKYYFSA